jgi:hypothetical protein
MTTQRAKRITKKLSVRKRRFTIDGIIKAFYELVQENRRKKKDNGRDYQFAKCNLVPYLANGMEN